MVSKVAETKSTTASGKIKRPISDIIPRLATEQRTIAQAQIGAARPARAPTAAIRQTTKTRPDQSNNVESPSSRATRKAEIVPDS